MACDLLKRERIRDLAHLGQECVAQRVETRVRVKVALLLYSPELDAEHRCVQRSARVGNSGKDMLARATGDQFVKDFFHLLIHF